MGNNSVPKFIFRLSRFPVYRGSVLGRFYCILSFVSAPLSSLSIFYPSAFFFCYFLPVSLDSFSFLSSTPSLFSYFIHFSFLHLILLNLLLSSSFISFISVSLHSLFILTFQFPRSTPSIIYFCTSFFISFFISLLIISFPSPCYLSYCAVSFILVFLSIFLLLPLFSPSCRSCFPCPYFLSLYFFSIPFLNARIPNDVPLQH